jgi:hypothetical protein
VHQLCFRHTQGPAMSFVADSVAKRFCASERARLIQDQAPTRNIDSRIQSLRFDCCVFLFYSLSSVTFATQSARRGLGANLVGCLTRVAKLGPAQIFSTNWAVGRNGSE